MTHRLHIGLAPLIEEFFSQAAPPDAGLTASMLQLEQDQFAMQVSERQCETAMRLIEAATGDESPLEFRARVLDRELDEHRTGSSRKLEAIEQESALHRAVITGKTSVLMAQAESHRHCKVAVKSAVLRLDEATISVNKCREATNAEIKEIQELTRRIQQLGDRQRIV